MTEEQLQDILRRVGDNLRDAGTDLQRLDGQLRWGLGLQRVDVETPRPRGSRGNGKARRRRSD